MGEYLIFNMIHWSIEQNLIRKVTHFNKRITFVLHRTTCPCCVMSTQAVHHLLWRMFYRVQEPLMSQSPPRNRSTSVGGWGNVIRPTRCTDQGTSYCFPNLLLPCRFWGCIPKSTKWASSENWQQTDSLLPKPGHFRPSVCQAQQYTHPQVYITWSLFASGLQWPGRSVTKQTSH